MNRTSVPPTVCSLALTATLALLCLQPTSEARPVTRPMPLATGASVCQADAAEEDYRYLAGLVERELWDLAVTAGNKFLGDHRRSLRVSLARYRLATALFSLDRHAEALPHWRELAGVAGFEYRLEAEFRAGECALALGQAEVASLHFAAVLAGDQTYLHAPAGFLLAEAHFQARDFGQAEAAYEQHLKAFPQAATAADARRALAWCAWEQGKAQPTVERARQFLGRHEGDPAAVEIALLLGEALLEIPDAEAALKTFRAIPNSHASADAALRGSGFALAALNRPAEAAQAFGQVLRQFPSSSFTRECRLQQGVQLVSAGQHKAAVEALAQLVSAKDAEACLWGGRAQAAQGAHELALATFDRGLAATDDEQLQGRIFVARGDALGMLGRSEEARASYAQGGSDYAIHAAAVSALNSGDIEGAERLAETLLKRGKEVGYRGPTLLVLGEARFQLGRWDAAEGAFVSALELAEDDASRSRSRSRIAWCHYRTADLAAAANGFASLAEDMPTCAESEEARRMAARALEEGGSREGAAQAWRIYLENNPGGVFSTEALIALARTTDDSAERGRALSLAASTDGSGLEGARALLRLAEDLSQTGDNENAMARFAELLSRIQGKDAELEARARYGLAWCHFDRAEFGKAGDLLVPLSTRDGLAFLLESDPDLAASALELTVWSMARAERVAEGVVALTLLNANKGAILPDNGRRFEVTRALAEAHQRAGEPAHGQLLYEALLQSLSAGQDAGDVAVRALIEGTYLSLEADDRDRAEAQLRTATQRSKDDPNVMEASFFVAEARLAAGEEDQALVLYARASNPNSPLAADALYKGGFVLLSQNKHVEAATLFARLVENHGDSPLLGEALFLLGEAHYRSADYAQVIAPLDRLRTELPRHEVRPKALFRLGLALGHLERWEPSAQALSLLAKEAPQFPNLAEAELWRGRALAALGQNRPARAALERVLQLDKGALAAEARVVKGNILQGEGRHEDALSEYIKVAVLYSHGPAVSESLYRAGVSLEALERPGDAAPRYREVLEDHGESAWAKRARAALARLESL